MRMPKPEKIEQAIKRFEEYFKGLCKHPPEWKELNAKAWNDATEMNAWISIYRHGNESISKRAGKIIFSAFGE